MYQKKRVLVFSHANPPPSIEIARRKLDLNEKNMAIIRADLESKTERDLGTCDRYDEWKIRATRALKMLDKEKNFLVSWISQALPHKPTSQTIPRPPSVEDLANAERIQIMVDDFLGKATTYNARSWNVAPQSSLEKVRIALEEMKERRNTLLAFRDEYSNFLCEVKQEALRRDFKGILLETQRHRVSVTMWEIEQELRALSAAKRLMSEQQKLLITPEQKTGGEGATPQPPSNPLTHVLGLELREIKNELQMASGDMCLFLHSLVRKNAAQMAISEEEKWTLDRIGKYLDVWLKCRTPIQPES